MGECRLEHNTQNNRGNAAEDEQNLSCTWFACSLHVCRCVCVVCGSFIS